MENGVSVAGNKDYPSNEDVEVQKLKDLVRKLEKQNEHLRNRTGKLVSGSKSRPVEPQPPDGDKPSVNTNTAIQFNDGIDLLDDDDMFVSNNDDESSWLYQSPAVHTRPKRTNSKSKQWRSPKEWLADEFEHPSTPQLASAKQNILYKLEGRSYSFDSSFTEPSFIQKSFDEQINLVDTYKPEDATDVKVVARMQQDELKKEAAISPRSAYDNKVFESPHVQERKGSIDDEIDRNSSSSGSPLHSHHLPVPSQTMTTAYGLYPSSM
uniref:Uncharacterized protein n=1 Tax=Ciona savignyi TaxID=51511 RepID=H2Z223_CIOSA